MKLTDAGFKYVPSAATDITATFRRMGFHVRTPEEQRAAAQAKLKGKKPRKAKRPLATVTKLERKKA